MHLATPKLIQQANLPRVLLLEYQQNPNYSFIPADVMKSLGMKVQFAEVTSFDDEKQLMTVIFSLVWSQTTEGEFCVFNTEAKAANVQSSVYLKTKAAMPYRWFTPEQLEKFKARNQSSAHQDWLTNKKESPLYPNSLMIWGTCDLSFLYAPNAFKKSESASLLSIIPWESPVFKGFHNAELNGFGFGTPAVECGKTDVAYNGSVWDNLRMVPDSLTAKTIQVTEEMKLAALPKIPQIGVPSMTPGKVAPPPVLNLPTSKPQIIIPPVAAAPTNSNAEVEAMKAQLAQLRAAVENSVV